MVYITIKITSIVLAIAIGSIGVSMAALFVQEASAKAVSINDSFHFNENQGNGKVNCHINGEKICSDEPSSNSNVNLHTHTTVNDNGNSNFNLGQVTKTDEGLHFNDQCNGQRAGQLCK